ncbi:RagB/SusD family nutrient uptake outer membrane protein [Hymenobacter ruricola]|uniref:RagB/SusD family nutrient uptake outer membrane protein n=1 Tax=Hymenobacter ruricola TaxID=2791023 RepID=A0ABS0I7X2_9BACT|nr:RagB/SusD family nutrient uptake outer membrane protein [Hymenobacter ruricola]MBF9223066.1 RagB/SusD family nutrient uptake outer membrane protein [Hymenobacter ruricola]
MKKTVIKVAALAVLMAAASSCSKDLLDENPRSILVPGFLGTPEGVQAGLVGVYSGLRNVTVANEEAAYLTVQGTDEFMRGISANQGYEDYNQGLLNSSNSAVTNQWNTLYRYINDANGVIQYAGSVQGLTDATKAQIVAETKVLRAYYYFLLVQYFGDVPLNLKFIDTAVKDISRAPKADVYAAIINDLTDALGKPASGGNPAVPSIADKAAQPGRVTRATALHLLARVYLTRATLTSVTAPSMADYTLAAQYANELISPAGQTRYGVGLETDAADVFREGNENGKEILMNVQFSADPTFTGISDNGAGGAGQNQSNFYFRGRYDFFPNVARSIIYGRPYARFISTPYLLNSYILPGVETTDRQWRTTDTRYNKWFSTLWLVNSNGAGAANSGRANAVIGDTAAWYPGRELTTAELARIAARPNGPYVVGTPSKYSTQFSPYINKWDDPTRPATNTSSDRPLILYRLAETYLIAAEANMMTGNLPAAVAAINAVRERAGAPGKKNLMDVTASQLNIDFILDERTRELCGEQVRWFDLVRTRKLIERVQKSVPAYVASKPAAVGTDSYGSDAAKNIVAGRTPDQFYLRPIPQQDIDRTNGKITQNPGYN